LTKEERWPPAVSAISALAPALSAQGSYSTAWLYRKTITIDRARVQATAPSADVPMLVPAHGNPAGTVSYFFWKQYR
jgi:hypothetical protein